MTVRERKQLQSMATVLIAQPYHSLGRAQVIQDAIGKQGLYQRQTGGTNGPGLPEAPLWITHE